MLDVTVDAYKQGPWPVIDGADLVCPAWHFEAEQLLDDDGWSVPSAEMANGSTRFYAVTPGVRRVSLQGWVLSDHDPDGEELDGTLADLEDNITALKAAVTGERGDGNRSVVDVMIGDDEVASVNAVVQSVRVSDRGGYPAEAACVITLVVTSDGA